MSRTTKTTVMAIQIPRCDNLLWGYLKSLAYRPSVIDEDDIRNWIVEGSKTPEIFERERNL